MSLIPLGGFQLPFQKRLSRLYSDTKKSSDFVKEPVQAAEDPEIKALHRKLRIQKDRLVTWGVEWSDPNQSAEIDESLSKAGLSEVVGSVMSTIKDILAEAEPLWQSYKGDAGGGGGSKDKKGPARVWDRGRFEDLVRDLTVSIDTLYDLSRTRTTATTAGFKGAPKVNEEVKAFESTRIETPHQIDPSTLTPLSATHPDATLDLSLTTGHEIVLMTKQAFADLAPSDPWSPLLLEFSSFDPIYSSTGIMPPMSRFERLSAGLQRGPQRSPGAWTGLPRLLGYFEDMERSRLGLLYQFPPAFNPVSFHAGNRAAKGHFVTLKELLARPDYEPRLEAKFRLAHNLANTVFDMHSRGVTHGNLVDGSVAFCTAIPQDAQDGEPDVRRPLVTSFDLFPDTPSNESSASQHPLFHHPLDPYITQLSPLAGKSDLRVLDLYSLAMILLSIGMWTSVENLVSDPRDASSVPESVLDKLAIRCGTLYMKAVETCWNAVEEELSGRAAGEEVLIGVQAHVSRCLEACCIIDGVSGVGDRVKEEETQAIGSVFETPPSAFKMPGAFKDDEEEEAAMDDALAVLQKEVAPINLQFKMEDAPTQSPLTEAGEHDKLKETSQRGALPDRPYHEPENQITAGTRGTDEADQKAERSPGLIVQQAKPAVRQVLARRIPVETRLRRRERADPASAPPSTHPQTPDPIRGILANARSDPYIEPAKLDDPTGDPKLKEHASAKRERLMLYPHVEIPPEVIDKWNKVIMPSINAALRQFYRKHPESVEISLEAIGPSPQATKPTVLVVCTSVGKVKAILSRKMADLYDGSSEFGLKVCRGKVIRSRGDTSAANAGYQERPLNGASIGAWIGYDHLPPVSFGGLVVVDDKAYGMTVHHMLDDPDIAQESYPPVRSAAHEYAFDVSDYECAAEFSDSDEETEADYSGMELASKEEEEEEEEFGEEGDIPGVEPGCGDGYVITQPAFDDVEEGFYPAPESAGEDHLDSCGLGTMYASSGIRRREEKGLVHEVDWALFEFHDARMPESNCISAKPSGKRRKGKGETALCPTAVASTDSLPGLEVQCVARTSGAQTGRIHPSLTSVKIYGRKTPSHTYQVSGGGPGERRLGVPGDSGAWLVDGEGRVAGHVLAWSQRKKVAYICPMDVLLLDIAEVLGAWEVRLPGGEAVVKLSWEEEEIGGLVKGIEGLEVWEEVGRSRADGGKGQVGREEGVHEGRKGAEDTGDQGCRRDERVEGKGRDVEAGISYLSEKVEEKGVSSFVCVEGVRG